MQTAWKNKRALRREYKSNEAGREKLVDLYAITEFVRYGLLSESFDVPPDAADAICLTNRGDEILAELLKRNPGTSESLGKFAVFLCFYHQDLLVDLEKTNVGPLRVLVHTSVLDGCIQYPWLFDHFLYDRAFDQFADVPQRISREDTQALLRDSPPGVFQLGKLLVGPFGVLESLQSRYFPPRTDLLLSHCPDPACNHAHVARIALGGEQINGLTSSVFKVLGGLGQPSEYSRFIASVQVGYGWYDDFSWKNLPWLLGSAFSERELRLLLTEAITFQQAELRSRFPNGGRSATKLKGAAADIPNRLSKPEVLQVLMLASDASIISAIDAAVHRGQITIPPSETRVSMASAETYSWLGLHCECSQLGVRVVSREGTQPLARLRRLILQMYTSAAERKQLAWMLGRAAAVGGIQEDTLGREVERFISERSPASALRELIFVSHEKLTQALSSLCASHFSLPADRSEDRRLADRMLWKLGFPRTHFDSKLETFYEKLSQFKEAACTSQLKMEDWKERVRAAGVNCFAAAEEIMDLALAFSTWLLLSDHYEEKHVFNLRRARLLVSTELSGVIRTEDGPLQLSPAGDNTLFPLVTGFLALSQRLSALLQNAEQHRKPEVLMAHYSHDSDLQVFPYKHDLFLFDASGDELDRSIKLLQSSNSSLQQSSVIGVGNGVIHPKQKFPTQGEIDSCCDSLEKTIQALEEAGLVPTVYATVKVQDDAFRRLEVTSINYGERSLKWSPSPALQVIRSLPSVREPQVIVPSLHLPGTAEVLRFTVEEESDYRELWRSYPRRRTPAKEDIEEIAGHPDLHAASIS